MSKTIKILGITGTYADLGRAFGVNEGVLRKWIRDGNTDSVIAAKLLARGYEAQKPAPAAENRRKKKKGKLVFYRATSGSGYYTFDESEE